MKIPQLIAAVSLMLSACAFSQLKIASLHPLMGDLAKQVGGERVVVVDIGKVGMNVHTFEPTAKDLQLFQGCRLVVASGKGLERYLGDLWDALDGVTFLEVGKTIPSRKLSGEDSLYVCCPDHAHGTVDPHWWHNVKNMERAVKIMEKELVKLDPQGADYYKARGKEARARMKSLEAWVKSQVAKIPKSQRKLVTAHAAFGYFCDAYRFKAVFVLGLSGDHEVPAKRLAEEIATLKKEKVRAVFPERYLNPKVLTQIAKEAGAKVGRPLVADGAVATYEEMMRNNLTSLVEALAQ